MRLTVTVELEGAPPEHVTVEYEGPAYPPIGPDGLSTLTALAMKFLAVSAGRIHE